MNIEIQKVIISRIDQEILENVTKLLTEKQIGSFIILNSPTNGNL